MARLDTPRFFPYMFYHTVINILSDNDSDYQLLYTH